MRGHGVRIVILGGIPEWEAASIKKCKGQNLQWFQMLQGESCETDKQQWQSLFQWYNQEIREFSKKHNNLFVFNTLDAICPQDKCGLLDAKGKLLYWDDDHLSDYAATQYIKPALKIFIETSTR